MSKTEEKEMKNEICDEAGNTHHSTFSMISFAFGSFVDEIMNVAFGVVVFFFYEVEILLNPIWIFLGYTVYSIWNAVNDPLVGYLTDRPFKFTKKWGRRFPWILIGSIGWLFMYILIFTPPNVNPVTGGFLLFIWLALTTSIYDTLSSVRSTNYQSLFPDKFRGRERRKASGIMALIGFFGIAIGAILPGEISVKGDTGSYITQAIFLVIIGLIAVVLMIPGVRDDNYMVERYLEKCEEDEERESFWEILKISLKHRNYRVIVLGYFLIQTTTACILSSIYYLTTFILLDPGTETLIMIVFLLGALISSPTWTLIANKVNNNRKMMIINGVLELFVLIPLLVGSTLPIILIGALLFGFAFGGHAVIYRGLIFPDAIDETVSFMGKRREGTFVGVRDFFGRLSFFAQAGVFALVHILTNFDATLTIQPSSAIIGIHIHLALVPMICIAIVTILIWKFYDITPEKSEEIKRKIVDLKL